MPYSNILEGRDLTADFAAFGDANALFDCDAIVVGVSGGPDSMCLLDLLWNLKKTRGDSFPVVFAAHLHHGLRGEEADRDCELVKAYADGRGIRVFVSFRNIREMSAAKRLSIEATGRLARYSFFEEVTASLSATFKKVCIATAHQREDQAETVLMHLFRGAGLDGLCGIRPRSANLIRPLLFASKADIYRYLELRDISFGEDSSNQDGGYSRNRWRNEVFPLLASIDHGQPVSALCSLAELLSEDRDYLEVCTAQAAELFLQEDVPGSPFVGVRNLVRLPPAIQRRLVRELWRRRFSDVLDLERVHVDKIIGLAENGVNERRVSLSGSRLAFLRSGCLFLGTREAYEGDGLCRFSLPGSKTEILLGEKDSPSVLLKDLFAENEDCVNICGGLLRIRVLDVENPEQVVYNNRIWYCPPELFENAVLRRVSADDAFVKAGSPGGKTLRRLFTDWKLPPVLRKRVLLIADGGRVLWIPGIGHSAGFVNEASRAVVQRERSGGVSGKWYQVEVSDMPGFPAEDTAGENNRN